ncbi:hypothetical protein L218DRAFT_1073898 [Marasmius fiardii PR-910]|nr:hypothetical protein L218DRAFT_1073898 [Marasmius fiardii PR-910]
MALAQRLNELAASHAQGLLNDDEYRLLRQDVFLRFPDTTIIPVETHIIPLESEVPISVELTDPDLPGKKQVEFAVVNPPIPFHGESRTQSRPKQSSVAAGVANLIRRATRSRRLSKESASSDSESQNKPRALIPRLLSKKSSDIVSTRSRSDSMSSYSQSRKTSFSSHTFSPLISPMNSTGIQAVASASKVDLAGAIINDDIFEDGELGTTSEIRQAISELVEEGRRLIDALNDLERSTIAKAYKDRPNVQPPLAETVVSANWPSASIAPARSQKMSRSTSFSRSTNILSNSLTQTNRTATIASHPSAHRSPSILRSKSSSSSLNSTNLASSSSSSIADSRRPRAATVRPHVSPLQRKASISSLISSHSNANFLSAAKKDALNSQSLNRSTGHLPLAAVTGPRQVRAYSSSPRRPSLPEGIPRVSSSGTSAGGSEDEIDPGVLDVRKRRIEVVGRYEARLEYLRARLKGAELHEKLLKK